MQIEETCTNPECDVDLSTVQVVGTKVKYCSEGCKKGAYRAKRKRFHSEMTSRWCYACQTEKPIDQYTKAWAPYCRACTNIRNKERYVRAGGADHAYGQSLRYRYGMTLDEYNHRRAEQDGKCAICGETPGQRLCVDHNHTTNAIRDLICTNCNHALGKAQDNPAILRAMADYLERHAQRDPAEVKYAPLSSARSLQRK
ncbi:endonuclease VII domain-containing protein [Streptomyces decoyicus]|uniref:endonuclease VII domain-containing protein n=1 Tax=Streptomyces decoyicus TaxID=249567 RepID=UPI002F9197CA